MERSIVKMMLIEFRYVSADSRRLRERSMIWGKRSFLEPSREDPTSFLQEGKRKNSILGTWEFVDVVAEGSNFPYDSFGVSVEFIDCIFTVILICGVVWVFPAVFSNLVMVTEMKIT